MTNETVQGFGLSPLQQHLWANDVAGRPVVARVRVDGELDPAALRAALERVVRAHEILRTAFPLLSGTHVPVQVIRDEPAVQLALADGDALAAEPFALADADVLRVALERRDDDTWLVLAQPALAADPVALWNVVRALAGALRGDAPAPAPEDEGEDGALHYADVAQWLHDHLASPDAEPGLAYWRALDDRHADLALPLTHDRGAQAAGRPERVARAWTAHEEEALTSLAARLDVAPSSVACAAWLVLLARHTDRDQLMIGDHDAGRGFEGLGEVPGPFGRLHPLAERIDAAEPFEALVRRVDATRAAGAEWHETFDPGHVWTRTDQALVYAFVAHEPVEHEVAGAVTFTLETRTALVEPVRLALVLDRGLARAELALQHDPRFLLERDARLLLGQLDTLLAAALADPAGAIGGLPLVSHAERARLLEEFGPGPVAPAPAEPVTATIAARAAQTPDAVAVVAPDGRLTYAELVARARRIARRLHGLGVGPGACVGLLLDRSTDQLAALLGVLEAGAAYLPLPPGYPAERIAFLLRDTAAPVVLTRTDERERLPEGYPGAVVALDDDAQLERASGEPLDDDAPRPALDDPAYVIYTSGSTGEPKGVPIPHRNLAHSTDARLGFYRHPVKSYLLVSSFAFDSSVVGIFWTLCQGGRLVLPPEGFEQEIPSLAELLREHEVTHTLALPSLHRLVLESIEPASLPALKTVLVAGESCPPELVALHRAKLPGVELFNEYGPTECTVWTSVQDCLAPFERPTVPIGRPIARARCHVVDATGELTPIGVAGELWVGGAGVAPGYLGRPELTAERFVSADFAPGERLYRTGDRVRWLSDGTLEFLGRLDHQVKLRGYRIELEEIESALAGHPALGETVVLAREDTPGDARLVAYATVEPGSDADAAALRAHLARTLPDYMVPQHFVLVADLPRLPNGKVDRNALPAPDQETSVVRAAYVAPRTPLERVLAAIWCEVLKTERVGRDDDFFDLGGHSILATQLFARMVEVLAVKVPLRAIFDARTLAGLAELLLADEAERARLERTAEVVLEVLEAPDE